MLEWCGEHDVRYLNTSLEEWDPYGDIENKSPYERSLYSRQMRVRLLKDRLNSRAQAESDRHHRSRRKPRPREPLHEASAARNRHDDAREGPAGGNRRQQGGVREADRRGRGPGRRVVCPTQPGHRNQGDPHLRARHAGVLAAEGRQRIREHVVDRRLLRGRHGAGRARMGHARAPAPEDTHTPDRADPAIRSFSRSRASVPSCIPGSLPAGRSSEWSSATPSPSRISDHLTVWDDTIEGRLRGLSPHGALRLHAVRQRDSESLRADHAQLPAAAEAENHVGRDHRAASTNSACC